MHCGPCCSAGDQVCRHLPGALASSSPSAACVRFCAADVAGLHWSSSPEGAAGFEVRMDGFSHKLGLLAAKVYSTLAGGKVRHQLPGCKTAGSWWLAVLRAHHLPALQITRNQGLSWWSCSSSSWICAKGCAVAAARCTMCCTRYVYRRFRVCVSNCCAGTATRCCSLPRLLLLCGCSSCVVVHTGVLTRWLQHWNASLTLSKCRWEGYGVSVAGVTTGCGLSGWRADAGCCTVW